MINVVFGMRNYPLRVAQSKAHSLHSIYCMPRYIADLVTTLG